MYELSNKMNINVEIYSVSCVPNKVICKDQHIKGYPTTRFYLPNSINGTEISAWKLHPHDLLRMAGISSASNQQQIIDITNAVGEDAKRQQQQKQKQRRRTKNDKSSPHFMDRSKIEIYNDAHLSFDFAMKTAVYTSDGPLSEDIQKVLKTFLEILQKTLPVTCTIQPVLQDLVDNFDSISKDDANLNKVLEKYPPPTKEWSVSSTQHGTGYTAGLWTLFHIMSIGLVEWNHMAIEDDQKLVPSKVADALRNYIEHFFQCDVCRLHFISEYDSCSYDRCNRLNYKKERYIGTTHPIPIMVI